MRVRFLLLFALTFSSSIIFGASVGWSSGTSSTDGFRNPNGERITSAMGYAVSVYFYSEADGKVLLNSSPSIDTEPNGIGAFTATLAPEYFEFKPNVEYFVKAIADGADYIRETPILAFHLDDNGDAYLNFASGSGLTNPSGGSNTWGDWTEKGGDVPEPTTCSLLLVGLAGMGLKKLRKRNKQA